MLRSMVRTHIRAIKAAVQARETLARAGQAAERAKKSVANGVDAGELSLARKEVMETRKDLAIAFSALKSASEDHSKARERCQHALAVAMCADTAVSTFMHEEDGRIQETARVSANALRNRHELRMADF